MEWRYRYIDLRFAIKTQWQLKNNVRQQSINNLKNTCTHQTISTHFLKTFNALKSSPKQFDFTPVCSTLKNIETRVERQVFLEISSQGKHTFTGSRNKIVCNDWMFLALYWCHKCNFFIFDTTVYFEKFFSNRPLLYFGQKEVYWSHKINFYVYNPPNFQTDHRIFHSCGLGVSFWKHRFRISAIRPFQFGKNRCWVT